jgi:hypothetical protein
LLHLARVLLRIEGADERSKAAGAIEQGLVLAEESGFFALAPQFLVERAVLARLRGDEAGRLRDLNEAHRLFTEMGARGHAERLAGELGL